MTRHAKDQDVNETERAAAKEAMHKTLHELGVRIPDLKIDGCHCNLVAEVALDALAAADRQGGDRFPVVTICGSMRFRAEMDVAAQQLSRDGFIVLMPFVTVAPDEQLSDPDKAMLDVMHRAKIDLAGSIYVVNPGGYVGESTRGEIAYAVATGKLVTAMVPLDLAPPAESGSAR